MQHVLIGALLSIVFLLGEAEAQHLWGGASRGMSVTEVEAAVDGAQRVEGGVPMSNGSVEELWAPGPSIYGEPFRASFLFDGDELAAVSLSPSQQLGESVAMGLFEHLTDLLRSKYGNEIADRKREVFGFRLTTWVTDEITIVAVHHKIGDAQPVVRIVYHTQVQDEAAGL